MHTEYSISLSYLTDLKEILYVSRNDQDGKSQNVLKFNPWFKIKGISSRTVAQTWSAVSYFRMKLVAKERKFDII